ncbi:MAG: twin-arginine translocation signal domain-containing protein [Solirubrobacteraceae bacterium]
MYEVVGRAASRLRAGRCSRRRFLGAAGALVGGALLAACGRDEAAKAPESDAAVLDRLLRHERATVAAMAGAPAALRDQDRRHAARLARELVALGGRPVPPGAPGDPASVPARKQQGVFTYVVALPRLADPELRVLVMQIAASEAAHLAALRLAAGEEPVPDAFAGFTETGTP